jgi:hypothetical protein
MQLSDATQQTAEIYGNYREMFRLLTITGLSSGIFPSSFWFFGSSRWDGYYTGKVSWADSCFFGSVVHINKLR